MIKKTKNVTIKLLLPIATVFILASCSKNIATPSANEEIKNAHIRGQNSLDFSDSLKKLGMMTKIYNTKTLRIQLGGIYDETGCSASTGAQIPRKVTTAAADSLLKIEGNIRLIPYNPDFLAMSVNTGYSDFKNKIKPDIAITGGITECDGFIMASVLKDKEDSHYKSLSINYNMLDFKTLTYIPGQTVSAIFESTNYNNTVQEVIHNNLMLNNYPNSRIRGFHHATRVLTQVSLIELIGKHLNLPYWNILPNHKADDKVVNNIKQAFKRVSTSSRIKFLQELLFVHGFDIAINSNLDEDTIQALSKLDINLPENNLTFEALFKVYSTVPTTESAIERRSLLNK